MALSVPAYRGAPSWRQTKYAYPRRFATSLGPIRAVNDAIAAEAGGPQVAQAMVNGWIERPGSNSGVRTRPGFAAASEYISNWVLPPMVPHSNSPLNVQAIFPFYDLSVLSDSQQNTNPHYIAIVNGHFYGGPDERPALENNPILLPAPDNYYSGYANQNYFRSAATLSATVPNVYVQYFANGYVVSDGVNPPFYLSKNDIVNALNAMSTGTPTPVCPSTVLSIGASGAQVPAVGPPAVYYGSLFFIPYQPTVGNMTQITWSAPLQPNLGYQMTVGTLTYTNFRDVGEAGSNPLTMLVSENDALYYFRASSIGTITGQVSSDFASSGVLDNISQTVGCANQASMFRVGSDICFIDQHGKPQRLIDGTTRLVPLWTDAMNALYQDSAVFGTIQYLNHVLTLGGFVTGGAYSSDLDVMVWSVTTSVQSGGGPIYGGTALVDTLLVFDGQTNGFLGTWQYGSYMADLIGIGVKTFRGLVTGYNGELVWMSTAGQFYCQFPRAFDPGVDYTYVNPVGTGNGGFWGTLNTTAIELAITFTQAQNDPLQDKIYDRFDIEAIANPWYSAGQQLQLFLGYRTSQYVNPFVGQQILAPLAGEAPIRMSWGLNAQGRFMAPTVAVYPTVFANDPPDVMLVDQYPLTIVGATIQGITSGDSPLTP